MSNSSRNSAGMEGAEKGDVMDNPGLSEELGSGKRTYAEKANMGLPSDENNVKPVFVRQADIPNAAGNAPTGEQIYIILAKVTSPSNIMGVQKVGGLWRLYVTDKESRIMLITEGIHMRGKRVPAFDRNPFLRENHDNLLRLTIKDIPLSINDEVIVHELESMKCKVQGKVVRQRLRVNGQLTNCLNGDRVLYVEKLSKPLERHVRLAGFRSRIFHDGQVLGPATVTCSRCLESGHHASTCVNPFVCQLCRKAGHKRYECPQSRDMRSDHGAKNTEARESRDKSSDRGATNRDATESRDPAAADSESHAWVETESGSAKSSTSSTQKMKTRSMGKEDRTKQQNLREMWDRKESAVDSDDECESLEAESSDEEECDIGSGDSRASFAAEKKKKNEKKHSKIRKRKDKKGK